LIGRQTKSGKEGNDLFATTKVFSFRQWFVCDRMRKSFLSKVSFVSIDSDGK
jgi:hypothetical protein